MEGFAQITLDETYSSAGFYGAPSNRQVFQAVSLEAAGEKFAFIDNENKAVHLYNLDHSLWQTMPYTLATDLNANANNANILYISQFLFDLDAGVEFMYAEENGAQGSVTQIINEDGSILFTADDQIPIMYPSVPQFQRPIYTTTQGTFMILSGGSTADGNAYVYTLPGNLSVSDDDSGLSSMPHNQVRVAIYPNPAVDEISIEYTLPLGTETGVLRITDIEGRIIETIPLEQDNGTIDRSTVLFGQGLYMCTLIVDQRILWSKEFLVVSQ
jgi:hypothetical protein